MLWLFIVREHDTYRDENIVDLLLDGDCRQRLTVRKDGGKKHKRCR
jgi:hypothetical protein